MFRKIAAFAVVLCVSFAFSACGGNPKTTMQGVEIELPPSKEVLRDTRDRFETREYKVTINTGKLTINSMSYGSVQKGDHVTVNADATVSVNGTARSGS